LFSSLVFHFIHFTNKIQDCYLFIITVPVRDAQTLATKVLSMNTVADDVVTCPIGRREIQ